MVFSLTILGCSSAMPSPGRFSTAQVLNVLERFFLIDCGEGTQIQLKKYHIKFTRINHVFISHLHGDHFLGLFGFMSSLSLNNRKLPLHIYGPFRLKELIDLFISTMERGIGFDIVFHPLHYQGAELIFEDDKVTVESFPLRHRVPTCGFIFREKLKLKHLKGEVIKELNIPIRLLQSIKEGADFYDEDGNLHPNHTLTKDAAPSRSFAFVTDTAKNQGIIPIIKQVDLLYHEATFADEVKKRAKETGHSTARQAGEIAKRAEVKKLIIGHFSHRYKSLEVLLNEAREEFPNTELAFDGAVFDVK